MDHPTILVLCAAAAILGLQLSMPFWILRLSKSVALLRARRRLTRPNAFGCFDRTGMKFPVRIVATGPTGSTAHVFDPHGNELTNVRGITVRIEAGTLSRATLEMVCTNVDLHVDGTMFTEINGVTYRLERVG